MRVSKGGWGKKGQGGERPQQLGTEVLLTPGVFVSFTGAGSQI